MTFITDQKQLKEANSSLTINLKIESLRSFLTDAEDRFRKILGIQAFDELGGKTDTDAHIRMRSAIVNLALGIYSDSGQLQISDSGMHVSKSTSLLPASDKKIISFKRSVFDKSADDFEMVLTFLESDIDEFPNWKDSQERKVLHKILIIDSNHFNRYSSVEITAGLFQDLYSEIKLIQRDCILPILGETLMDTLLDQVWTRSLGPHHKKLWDHVLNCLVPLSLAGFIPYQMIDVSAHGVFQRSYASQSDNIEVENSPNARVLQRTMNRMITTGEGELETLRIWLNKNSGHFSTYTKQAIAPMAEINQGLEDTGVYFL